jgi:hypothetical protein
VFGHENSTTPSNSNQHTFESRVVTLLVSIAALMFVATPTLAAQGGIGTAQKPQKRTTTATASKPVEALAIVVLGGRQGYIDTAGHYVINPQFYLVYDFHEGLAAVDPELITKGIITNKDGSLESKIEYKFGYIDKTGEFVINPQFEFAGSFSEGLAPVQLGGVWGYIDKTGKYQINPQFEYEDSFSEGLARVKTLNGWGYVDKTGKYVISPQFDHAGQFAGGLAFVSLRLSVGSVGSGAAL